MTTLQIIFLISIGMGGIFIGLLLMRVLSDRKIRKAEEQAKRLIKEAESISESKGKEILLEAKEKAYQMRLEVDKEIKDRSAELSNVERRFHQREENLDKKMELLEKRETELSRRERDAQARERQTSEKEARLEQLLKEQRFQLEKIAGLTAEEAKRQLLVLMEKEAKFEAARMIKRIEDEARESADRKAKEIIATSIQRCASDYVVEATVSVVNLPNDDMKGRIIGREGRNIRALEGATGIDLIIDDTPGAVILSGYDPIRREIARISLERLMADGRIHPARIEEVVKKVKAEVEEIMKQDAEKVMFDVGIHDLHQEEIKLLGKLRYRTSYGQNNLVHAREVTILCGIMATELGLDVKLAKRAALLHDIGKAVDYQEEGTHAALGAELAKKFNESPKVVNAIAAHHEDVEPLSPEAVLVAAADALSAARPGARRETLEAYIKRLEKLEEIAQSFKGVEKAYAIQAGRELRIIVSQEDVSDAESAQLSREIAKKIESELSYPGQIKVTVIRESRYVEYAK